MLIKLLFLFLIKVSLIMNHLLIYFVTKLFPQINVFKKNIAAFPCNFLYSKYEGTSHLRELFLAIKSLSFMSAYAAEKYFEIFLAHFLKIVPCDLYLLDPSMHNVTQRVKKLLVNKNENTNAVFCISIKLDSKARQFLLVASLIIRTISNKFM